MKILIVKTSSLGDIVHAFPTLDYLRSRFPEAQIDWVAENSYAELLLAHPQINSVLRIESKTWRTHFFKQEVREHIALFRKKLRQTTYDVLFDLQGNIKSAFIIANARAKKKVGFGWKSVPEWPNTLFTGKKINPPSGKNVREDYLAIVKGHLCDTAPYHASPPLLKLQPLEQQKLYALFAASPKPTLVCASAAWSNKCLSEETLIHLLKKLNHRPYWFIWGNPQERTKALYLASHFGDSSVLERCSLPLLQHIMARCQLVVAMDSLPLHLCGTTETPTLSFFGPSLAEKYKPLGSHHQTVQGECPYNIRFEKRCPRLRTCSTGLCLKSLNSFDGVSETAEVAHL